MNISNDRWVFQDTISAPANGATLYGGRWDQVTLYITGTATVSTVIFEGSDKDGNWYSIPAFKMPDYTLASQTTGIGEAWVIDLSKWQSIRARVSAVSGGHISVVGRVVQSNG